jgi:hypothetical protein
MSRTRKRSNLKFQEEAETVSKDKEKRKEGRTWTRDAQRIEQGKKCDSFRKRESFVRWRLSIGLRIPTGQIASRLAKGLLHEKELYKAFQSNCAPEIPGGASDPILVLVDVQLYHRTAVSPFHVLSSF